MAGVVNSGVPDEEFFDMLVTLQVRLAGVWSCELHEGCYPLLPLLSMSCNTTRRHGWTSNAARRRSRAARATLVPSPVRFFLYFFPLTDVYFISRNHS